MSEQLTKYQVWYRKNKEKLSARRRQRYRADKKYREKNLKACRKWRGVNKPWRHEYKIPRPYLLIGEFAELVGCSPETLRNLERKKLIPSTTDGVTRRHYNPANAALVRRLVDFRRDTHYTEARYQARLKQIVATLKSNWRKAA